MGLISPRSRSPPRQHDLDHSTYQLPPDPYYNRSSTAQLPSMTSGNMTMRWRGATLRRMSMFPSADPAHQAFTEEAIRSEIENEEQNLVKELVELSTRNRIRAIRDLPKSFKEKKHIRRQVLAIKSVKESRHFTCFTECSQRVSLSFRRFGSSISAARQTLELWQGTMKEIGGKFGTSVLTYFQFLKWLLMFNVFSFLVNFCYITIPLLVYEPSPNIPKNVNFTGLELLTGAGYFTYTSMYYGAYSNSSHTGLVHYNMQLAYFFTIAVYMVLCGIALILSMASSFKTNYVLADPISNSAWQLLCSWDFNITNERAVRQRKNNLWVQLKESLSEKAQREMQTLSERIKQVGVHLGSWLLSTALAVGCGASIFFLCKYENELLPEDTDNWSMLTEAQSLLVPFVVSLMNLVVPLFYSLFNKFEQHSNQRKQIYALLVRNVLLKISILAVLCYYWMDVVAEKYKCWESMVGQALYRLVVVDFLFLMLGSFFGEFLSNVIGTKLLPRLGIPEFDVARNVLEIIYAQSLAWIGIYFAPLLPVIQILKFFILFYLKKVSLTQNCQPPRRTGRAAQMQTIFIGLLFIPCFVGALSIVGYTAWSLTPSEECGPFRGLNTPFSVVGVWMEDLEANSSDHWVIWIYENVIRSEIFYFCVTIIILIVIYIFWQITQGRKLLIGRLRQQIVNRGKDKSFLLEKLQRLQRGQPDKKSKQKNQKKHTSRHSGDRPSGGQSSSNAVVQALLARQRLEEDEGNRAGGVPVPSDIFSSSFPVQATFSSQRAGYPERDKFYSEAAYSDITINTSSALTQAMHARQRAEDYRADDADDVSSSVSSVMMQVMQARQRAEEERLQWAPRTNAAPAGSSALIQAMLARQQAQNEYDDGY